MKSPAPAPRPSPISAQVNIPWEPVARGDLTECLLAAYDAVARRAYEIFRQRGQSPGRELEDWLKAEREILQKIRVNVQESEFAITALASIPGFRAREIEVAVEPQWMVILGRHGIDSSISEIAAARSAASEELPLDNSNAENTDHVTALAKDFCERGSDPVSEAHTGPDPSKDAFLELDFVTGEAIYEDSFGDSSEETQLFCVVELPAPVDPVSCCAVLHDGLLGVRLLKAVPSVPSRRPTIPSNIM